MEANTTTQITNEMLMEHFIELKSMLMNLQSEMESLKNPVEDFTTKLVDTYDVMTMFRVSRRTMDNYIKAGKLTPTRIQKRNYFAIKQVNGLIYIHPAPVIRTLR
jgi:aspartate carbamoyltransferase catalytic subunit